MENNTKIRKFGNHSYDLNHINILSYSHGDENYYVEVGNFTSIAVGCTILLSHGGHNYKTGTNYHFNICSNYLFDLSDDTKTSGGGSVIIGSDVWIGRNVTIMSGITIGDGAVIATNSHIVKDIPPYSIYGGNPAKLIKYRFNQQIIDKFIELKWWDLPDKTINKILPLLQKEPSLEMFDTIYSYIEADKNITPIIDHRREDIIQIYKQNLGRYPDKNGFQNYYNSQLSIDEIKKIIISSEECKQRKL